MELKGGDRNRIAVCFAEMIGTAMLMVALNLSGLNGSTDEKAVAGSVFVSLVTFG